MNTSSIKFKFQLIASSLIFILILNYFLGIINFQGITMLLKGDISGFVNINVYDVIKITTVLTGETAGLSYGFYYITRTFLKGNVTSK